MLEKVDDEIEVLRQTPLHPKKKIGKNWKKKKVKKEIEDEIETLGQTPMHPRKRLEMTNKIKNIK